MPRFVLAPATCAVAWTASAISWPTPCSRTCAEVNTWPSASAERTMSA